jgi:hypothetical protein
VAALKEIVLDYSASVFSDLAYPTIGFFAVADELEVHQALMAVNGIDQAVIAPKADGEAVCPPLKLLALVRVQ